LHPHGDDPAAVACSVGSAASDTSGQNTAYEPESIVQTSDDTTMSGMGCLDDVKRAGGGHDGYSETEQETATHELSYRVVTWACSGLDDDTGAANGASNHHSVATSESVASGSDEWESDDTSNLVHGCDDTRPGSGGAYVVVRLEGVVGEKSVKHGSVETIASGAEEAHKSTDVEHESM
tara:strand:- start:5864 stop:6400 length:537 start_codon:yes stop_codon:yes gene_type:complete